MKKKLGTLMIAAIVCAALCLCCIGGMVAGLVQNSGMSLDKVRGGIVWVYTQLYDSAGNWLAGGSGTGWAIGVPGQPVEYIVTNGHVVQNAFVYPKAEPQNYIGQISVYFSAAENDYVNPQVVFYSGPEEKDIAVLKLPTPTTKRTALTMRASDTVVPGETAYALGYPGISSERQSYVTYDSSDITITQGVISKQTNVSWADYNCFQMDVSIAGGNSGGPLVDAKGRVLGINTSSAIEYVSESSYVDLGMNYAIIADDLTRILDAEGIPYAKVRGDSPLALCFGIAAAVFLVAAVVLFVMEKKSAPKPATATPAYSPARGMMPPPTPATRRPTLRCIGGRFAGQTFDLSSGLLSIGRDPVRCGVVFPPDAPGISGFHCSVGYDPANDCFLLTDQGSSYGTFLGDGRKLTPAVPERLGSGAAFRLADTDNRFVVAKE